MAAFEHVGKAMSNIRSPLKDTVAEIRTKIRQSQEEHSTNVSSQVKAQVSNIRNALSEELNQAMFAYGTQVSASTNSNTANNDSLKTSNEKENCLFPGYAIANPWSDFN